MSGRSQFHYVLEWDNGYGSSNTFEFELSDDPFTEPEDGNRLLVAKWDGFDVLANPFFIPAFKHVQTIIFRWLKREFPDERIPDERVSRRRRDIDNVDELEEELDSSFDEVIRLINLVPRNNYNPKFVQLNADSKGN